MVCRKSGVRGELELTLIFLLDGFWLMSFTRVSAKDEKRAQEMEDLVRSCDLFPLPSTPSILAWASFTASVFSDRDFALCFKSSFD